MGEWVIFLGTLCGYIAFITGVSSYQFKNGGAMLTVQMTAAAIWIVHYASLGAFIAIVGCIIAILRNMTTFFVKKERLKQVAVLSAISVTVTGIPFITSYAGVLCIIGNILACTAVMFKDEPFKFRLLHFLTYVFFLIYTVSIASVPAIAFASFMIASNAVSLLRYEKDNLLGLLGFVRPGFIRI